MISEQDDIFLRRALRLAMNGRGHVEPNPMVGCVLAKNGQIIGEGWHKKFGEAHAEPTALADCKARGNDPAGATAYVTLEPCCHLNKKTPPCAPRLIEAKIARVVIGCLDPNPDVNGKGVAMLRAAGIAVDILPSGTGFQPVSSAVSAEKTQVENLCHERLDASHFQQLISQFILRQQGRRPYVTMKWAEAADGKVAGAGGRRTQISNPTSSHLVHVLRSRSDAIVVGINTVLNDDPLLTIRGVATDRKVTRAVLDSQLRIPLTSKLVASASEQPVVVYCYNVHTTTDRGRELAARGVQLIDLDPVDLSKHNGDQRMSLTEMLADWSQDSHVLVEPGPSLAKAFYEFDLADRLWQIRSAAAIGDDSAPSAAAIPDHYVATGTLDLAGDTLTEYLNTNSPAFFAVAPSADFVLAQEAAAGQPVT